jgi:outer membrane murein-binding lipoprotein Lpp
MRKFLVMTLASTSIYLLGCAAPQKLEWLKEGASKLNTDTANSECTYQIKLNKTEVSEQSELLKLCMQGKGYRLRQMR